jgi:hypothetical protein
LPANTLGDVDEVAELLEMEAKAGANIGELGDETVEVIGEVADGVEGRMDEVVEGVSNLTEEIASASYDINKLLKTQPYLYTEVVSNIKETIIDQGPNAIKPIEIRVHNGQVLVVEGHHRLEAFRQLGYARVPIKYLHGNQLGKVQGDGFTYYRDIDELLDGLE